METYDEFVKQEGDKSKASVCMSVCLCLLSCLVVSVRKLDI